MVSGVVNENQVCPELFDLLPCRWSQGTPKLAQTTGFVEENRLPRVNSQVLCNKKLLGTSASLLVTSALLVVTRINMLV